MAILDDNEFVEVEGRQYLNPQVALDESNQFIDNLRSTQQANNQEIQTQTYNLGSDLPSQLGGLGAPGDTSLSYFTSRYQTPQTASAVANLRATAQAAALNQVLENEQEKWKKRYNDAYRAYQKSAYDKSNLGNNPEDVDDGVEEEIVDVDDTLTSANTLETPKDPVMDFVQGKGDWTISYTKDGKQYFGNVYYKTGVSGDRYSGLDTSTGVSYSGQNALNYLNGIVASGGKIYGPDGQEVTPQQALTGAPGRW